MSTDLKRRRFLRMAAGGVAGLAIGALSGKAKAKPKASTPVKQITYREAPELKALAAAGALPLLADRLPAVPLVLEPLDGVQNYGGILNTFSPWTGGDLEECQYGHSPLRWIDDGTEMIGGMCDWWSTNANNTIWVVHIRVGLKWSDGQPVTVQDILFWWNDLVLGGSPSTNDDIPDFGHDGNGLATFSAVDDYTLEIAYTHPAPLTGYRLAMWVKGNIGPRWIAPRHYLEQFHPAYNPLYPNFDTLIGKATFRTNPDCPSLNPWVCVHYTGAPAGMPDRNTWRRNPYYYAVDPDGHQLPYIDGWQETGLIEHDAQLEQVLAGKVDFSLFHNFTLSDLPQLQAGQATGRYQVRLWDSGSGTGMLYMWNYDHPDAQRRALYRTPQFKQAMSHALNRPIIQALVYANTGFPTTGTMSPKALEFNYNTEARNRFQQYRDAYVTYNPALAGTLLDSIGVVDSNMDTWREFPGGDPLVISIDLEVNSSTECLAVLNIAVNNWRAVGLDVRVNTLESGPYWDLVNQGQWDMRTNWEASDGPNHLVYPSWMSPDEPNRWAPLCGNTMLVRGTPLENTECGVSPWLRNPPRYCSSDPEYAGSAVAQIHQIYLQAITEPGLMQRIQYVWQMLDIHRSNVFYLGTVANRPRIILVSTNLGNVPTRDDLELGGFVDPWIVPYPAVINPETWSFINLEKMFLPVVRR